MNISREQVVDRYRPASTVKGPENGRFILVCVAIGLYFCEVISGLNLSF